MCNNLPTTGYGVGMSGLLLFIVTIIYSIVAIDQFFKGNPALATVYLGYTVANVGLMIVVD